MSNPLIADPVFKDAKWIWLGWPQHDLLNSWVHVRKTFRVAAVPRKAVVHVTGDTRYRLYVNGRHVNRGPARGFQVSWPYDTVDIAPYLTRGKNAIAAIVHNTGVSTFQYIHQTIAGFLLAGRVAGQDVSTNNTWKARRAPGHLPIHTRVISPHLGFQEYFDARLEDDSWLLADYEDSEWQKATALNFGCMPWHSLEPRGIPLLREEPVRPADLVSTLRGKCMRGYAESTNVVELFCEEGQAAEPPVREGRRRTGGQAASGTHRGLRQRQWQPGATRLRLRRDWATLDVPPTGKDGYASYCIDFGAEVVGSLRYLIEGAQGGEIIDTVITEGLNGLAPIVLHPTRKRGRISMGNRLLLAKGRTEHEQFDHWGFRYVILIVRNTRRKIRLSLRLKWVGYPLDVKGSFDSSDPRLDQIYQISAWTQQCCMLDSYMDCPWREQAQWWGDARVQAANTFYLSADARMLARGIRQIGTQQIPNGLTYGLAPAAAHNCILPDFTLTWIMTQRDYWWQTGDLSLFTSMQHRVHHALDYFDRAADNRFGLLAYDDRYWLFLDWCPLFKDGYPTLYNAFYLMALEAAAELFRLAGNRSAARLYAERGRALRRAIETQLFNRKDETFYGGLDWRGKPVPQDSGHVAALAILTDLVPRHRNALLEKVLLPVVRSNHSDPLTPSPFYTFYMLQALKKVGRNEEVVDCIDRWWGDMVDRGLSTTEEVWNATVGSGSLCHAWSAHPVVHLSNVLLGIWQNAPGWNAIRFAPTFTKVDRVAGKVATPLGVIASGWDRTGDRPRAFLKLPKGITATVAFPGRRPEKLTGPADWTL
jgi:alpha-L-rhamnosidase